MGVLLLLLSMAGFFTAVVLLIAASLTKKAWLAKFTVGGVGVWLVFYAAMLLGFSLTSTEKVLAAGEAKEYCGFYIDCHMHTTITGIRTAQSIGDKQANGQFYIVNVKVFSNARNPAIAFRLLESKARVFLANGEKIARDTSAESLLATANIDLGGDIKGSQKIKKEIVFDIPVGSAEPKLLITEGYGIDKVIERILVGDEDSLLHAQTFFELKERNETARVK